jgi:hypothetical protein
VDFEKAALLKPNSDEALRIEQWVEKGVTFKLAHEPKKSKAKGLVMFFEHLSNGHKGLASAMALEPIPVRATFPRPASRVSVSFWGSTGTPALLEALDAEGNVVDRASLVSIPGRQAPGEPVPIFTMKVSAPRIAAIQFSGPRPGEFLAADEVRLSLANDTAPAAP